MAKTSSFFWEQICKLDPDILKNNASTIRCLYGCENILDLPPLPKTPPLETPKLEDSILSKRPAFKNLDISGIRYLRNQVEKGTNLKEIRGWAETLMRFLEIFQSTLKAKVRKKFGYHPSGRIALLEMTAFMMDCHFAWDDLRYLNTAMKLMDYKWIYSIKNKDALRSVRDEVLEINLLQIRLMIMREAALHRLCGKIKNV